MDQSAVVVGAGSLRSREAGAIRFPHRWTAGGVTVEADFTGAHLLHLTAAGCVLNDVYREAVVLGLSIGGVQVTANGGFDARTWASTGITYTVQVSSPATGPEIAALLELVDAVAEIPRALRAGASVERGCGGATRISCARGHRSRTKSGVFVGGCHREVIFVEHPRRRDGRRETGRR